MSLLQCYILHLYFRTQAYLILVIQTIDLSKIHIPFASITTKCAWDSFPALNNEQSWSKIFKQWDETDDIPLRSQVRDYQENQLSNGNDQEPNLTSQNDDVFIKLGDKKFTENNLDFLQNLTIIFALTEHCQMFGF